MELSAWTEANENNGKQYKYYYSREPILVLCAQSNSQSHYQEVSLGHLLKYKVSITISQNI